MTAEMVVTGLAVTSVKSTRLRSVERIELDREGARGNRRFYVIDARNRMVNAKTLGELETIVADCPVDGADVLRLTFPDGTVVEGAVELGEPVSTRFFSGEREARVLSGPWSAALSERLGRPLTLVAPAERAVDRGPRGAATLISRASLARLAERAGEPAVDARRFRMLIEIDGIGAHDEDGWVGRTTQVGEALIGWAGHVGRCLITSRHPESGDFDLPTLDVLREYRGGLATTEPLPFGIYGEVLRGGVVSVGDRVLVT
jgi:uncharacterized protein YcbX